MLTFPSNFTEKVSTNTIPDKELSSGQTEILEHPEGAMLILAGAGSGKTHLLAHRYARLYKEVKDTDKTIFTITLSNKAAIELKEIIDTLLNEDYNNEWIGTIYSMCSKILRQEIDAIGYKKEFLIYNEEDQSRLIRHILKSMSLYEALYKGVASKINIFKISLLSPEALLSSNNNFDFDEKILKVYLRYQDEMKRSNVLDLNDLIMLTVKLFEEHPSVQSKYSEMFHHILVDEFQDINYAQYRLLKLLANDNKNICVVGDNDQCLVKCKGYEIKDDVMSMFKRDFPDSKVFNLDQTYRNTRNILDVSHSVASSYSNGKPKKLCTERGEGEKVNYCWFNTEKEEAVFIAKTIKDIYLKGRYSYHDIAVFYRINFQSKILKETLKSEKIPFKEIGSENLCDKPAIINILALLKLMINKDDNLCMRMIFSSNERKLNQTMVNKIEELAKREDISLYQAIRSIYSSKGAATTVKEKLNDIISFVDTLCNCKSNTVPVAINFANTVTGCLLKLDEETSLQINELKRRHSTSNLIDFLDTLSLATQYDDNIVKDKVSLVNLSNVKGMEFSSVFIAGLEDGVLPYFKATSSPEELDSERRLFYGGITRAKDYLFITGAKKRRLYSKYQEQEPSRFLDDIPRECCQWFAENIQKNCRSGKEKKESKKEKISPYNTGCRVKHTRWGVGVIRDCYGEENDIKVTVNFPDVGVKKLSLKYAKLEKI